jgi:hypothetical protein
MSGTFNGIGTLQFTPDNKHAYFYGGEHTAHDATTKRGEFETGSYFLVGEVRFSGYSDMGSPAAGATGSMRVVFNNYNDTSPSTIPNQNVLNFKTDGATEDQPFTDTAKIIIPPFTLVQFWTDASTGNTSYDGTISAIFDVKGSIEQFSLEVKE